MPTERAEPVLPAKNLNETRSFYRKLELVPSDNSAGCYWRATNADQFYGECVAHGLPATGVPRLEGLCDQPWGMREFVLVDPSGNLLRIGHERDNDD